MIPNFFVVGTGKAGTTSLHGYLAQHPQIYMSPVKEPGYFASEVRAANLCTEFQAHVALQTKALAGRLNDGKPVKPLGWLAFEWEDYERLFQGVRDEIAIGESSPIYLWSETAAQNIHARVPGAKIVMVLRDPAERAFSHYLHQLSVGFTRSSFREHIQACLKADRSEISTYHPFLEIGMYSRQVKRYLEQFPRERIRIYWYEQNWKKPEAMLADLFGFLGVDEGFRVDTAQRMLERRAPRFAGAHYLLKKQKLWETARSLVPQRLRPAVSRLAFRRGKSIRLDPADRRFLVDYYREDIGRLQDLLEHDLTNWLRCDP